MEHLLRDIHFTIRTDHRNLTYINTSGSPKVIRWKIAMGEFDFDIEHIRGVDNVAADGFSRLCPVMLDRQIVTGVEGDGIPQRVDGNDDLHHPRDSSTREVSDSLMLLR